MTVPSPRPSCPSLDPRQGFASFVHGVVHVIATRGHAACGAERVALLLVESHLAILDQLERLTTSLRNANDVLERNRLRADPPLASSTNTRLN